MHGRCGVVAGTRENERKEPRGTYSHTGHPALRHDSALAVTSSSSSIITQRIRLLANTYATHVLFLHRLSL